MVTNKEKVFEFIVEYTKEFNSMDDEILKFDTNFISAHVGIHRSNVSTILNQLVEEGKVIKYKGRPVLYSLSNAVKILVEDQSFTSLIGYDGSLQQAIQYTKAAIAYPKKRPKILYIGEKGTGVQALSKEAYEYACSKGILKRNAPYSVINCAHYGGDQLDELLTGQESVLKKCDHGLILLKNADNMLPCLIEKIMENYLKQEDLQMILMFHVVDERMADRFKDYLNFIVRLYPLKDRGMTERYKLVELFFRKEAGRLNRRIEVSCGLMQCLMLYPCPENCHGLRNDIQFGIANAFLKAKKKENIKLELSDFPNDIRKGLLHIPSNQDALDEVIRKDISAYIFEKKQTYCVRNKEKNTDIYHRLDKKQKWLRNAINYQEMDNFVSANIESELGDYLEQLTDGFDEKKLEKIISEKLRRLVREFLNKAGQELNKEYSDQIYYGICLHFNNAIITTKPRQRISNEKMMEIMEQYDKECLIARKFIREIQTEFNVKFSIDETIYLSLILALDFENSSKRSEVVTLIAMHGEAAASSIVEGIRYLLPVCNIDAFNLSWNDEIDVAYEKLKQKIISCNKGMGILVIYDTGSIQVMLNSIIEETNIKIRSLEIPLNLIAMSSCLHSKAGDSIDEIYRYLIHAYSDGSFLKP